MQYYFKSKKKVLNLFRTVHLFKAMLPLIVFCIGNSAIAQEKKVMISVLPFSSNVLEENLLGLYTEDFRKYLEETGEFIVITRNLKEILEEQELQQSDLIDSTTIIKVGKIFGVSRIISGIITREKFSRYTVSVSMVDVETGKIIRNVSESRNDGSSETIRRMLRNITDELAGKPNPDRKRYNDLQNKLIEIMAKNWRIGFGPVTGYHVHIFTQSSENALHTEYLNDTAMTAWGPHLTPYDFGGMIRAGYRLSDRIWLNADLSYCQNKDSPQSYSLQGVTPDSVNYMVNSITESGSAFFRISAGAGFDLIRFPSLVINLSIAPAYALITQRYISNDTQINSTPNVVNKVITSYSVLKSYTESTTNLSGSAYGFDASVSMDWFFHKGIALNFSVGLNSLFAPTLEGTTKYNRHSIYDGPSGVFQNDSSWTEPAALIKGNFYGTGEYTVCENPDKKQYNSKGPVDFREAMLELSRFYLQLSINFYF